MKTKMTSKIGEFSKFLGDNQWLVGGKVTVADFVCYEILHILRAWQPDMYESFPKLVEYLKRFEKLPQIKAYMESPRYYVIITTA